jgi:tellurite methyltransferase
MQPASLTQRLLGFLPPDASVLDLGCGTGLQARALGDRGFRVFALDNDFDALATARELGEDSGAGFRHLDFLCADLRALPFAEARFDAVLCLDVLHWSADAEAFAASWNEALRVLRPGGLLAARLRALESSPEALSQGAGRYRPREGGEWFLAGRADLEALAAQGARAEWLEPPALDGDSLGFLLRKR